MTNSRPKFWERVGRYYEVTYPSGQKVTWSNITITDCLTKYNGHNSMYDNQLQIREIIGKELALLKVKEK